MTQPYESEFNVACDQLVFLDGRIVPYAMPAGYVYDFLFCPPGTLPALEPSPTDRRHVGLAALRSGAWPVAHGHRRCR